MVVVIPLRVLMVFFIGIILLNLINYIFYSFYESLPFRRPAPLETITKSSSSISKEKKILHRVSVSNRMLYGIWHGKLVCDEENTDITQTTHPTYVMEDTKEIGNYSNTDKYTYYVNDYNLKDCSEMPANLGPVTMNRKEIVEAIEITYSEVEYGGYHRPVGCVVTQTVAIIVPYNSARRFYTSAWLYYMHPFLMKQRLEYRIFIIQHDNSTRFNKGNLLNIGYLEAKKWRPDEWSCLVFHEPYLMPTDTRNLYRCNKHVKQLFSVLDDLKNEYRYSGPRFGGVVAMAPSQFIKTNGFSNNFWEEESETLYNDMYGRIIATKQTLKRSPDNIGSYAILEGYLNKTLGFNIFRATNPLRKPRRDREKEKDKEVERAKIEIERTWQDLTITCTPALSWYLRRTWWRETPAMMGFPRQLATGLRTSLQISDRPIFVFKMPPTVRFQDVTLRW